MKTLSYDKFLDIGRYIKRPKPLYGLIALTYRCNLNCVHCYCDVSAKSNRELDTKSWKDIIDQLVREGCLCLIFTGGEPMLRKDFPELYAYAYRKGFLVTVFTNGTLITEDILKLFKKYPPLSIDISLYGASRQIHDLITRVPGSYNKVWDNINKLIKLKMPLFLRTVAMKQNKNHVLKIKELSERLLGKNKFEMDLTIIPRINGDISNLKYRLSRKEILELRNSDAAIKRCEKKLYKACTAYKRPRGSLFRCSAGTNAFSIDPFGTLTACPWVKKYSCSLKDTTFKKGFYYVLSEARKKKYTTKSKCKNCKFLNVCGICPARAYLETGNEENPAEYYCRLAD